MHGSKGDADVVDMEGGKGEGGTNGESITETYTPPYVKQTAGGDLLFESGNSNQSSVMT